MRISKWSMRQRCSVFILPTLSALLLTCAGLVVHSIPVSAAPPAVTRPATAVVTDQAKLTLSNSFAMPPSQVRLTDGGEVLFTSQGSTSLFRWDGETRTRLLQANDPMPGYPGGLVNSVGVSSVNSAGHAAVVLTWVQKGKDSPNGLFVYNGTNYQKVAVKGEEAPYTGTHFTGFGGTFINVNDQVAFVGNFRPAAVNRQGIFVGEPGEDPTKIALLGEPAPGTSGTYGGLSIRGLTDSGDVVFFANVQDSGGSTYGAFFQWNSTDGVNLIAKQDDTAPGTGGGSFSGGLGTALVNADGNVAFVANVTDAAPTTRGIWVWDNATATISALVLNTDSVPPTVGDGIYGGSFSLRGFNDNGKVLFSSNVGGISGVTNALFLKEISETADVVFYQGQDVLDVTEQKFQGTQQAALNNSDAVAFLAQLQGGQPNGWFLWTTAVGASAIVLNGDPLLGGTAGLMGRTGAPFALQLNGDSNLLVLTADIVGPNITATLLWDGFSFTPIVKSDDVLPAGANVVIRTPNGPRASDDEVLFQALRAGGALTYFTTRLKGPKKIRRIVGEGDIAPGGGTIVNLGETWINTKGTVSISAGAVVGASTFYPMSAIYISKPGVALQKLVASGDTIPPGGALYFSIGTHRLNNNDQVAFFSGLMDPNIKQGIFLGSLEAAAETVVLVSGDASVILSDSKFSSIGGQFAINDSGLVAFNGTVKRTSDSALFYGLFAWDAGDYEKIVLQGDPLGTGPPFGKQSSVLAINRLGQLAYAAFLEEGYDTLQLWDGPGSGPPQILAYSGAPASGSIGATFNGFVGGTININSSGKVAFGAVLIGANNNPTAGYFLWDGSNVRARLREGDALPGGGLAGPALAALALSEAGEVAMYVPDVTGAPNFVRYVIANAAGTLRELATADSVAPGTGNSTYGRLYLPLIANPSGQFLFTSALAGKGAQYGVFASSPPKK